MARKPGRPKMELDRALIEKLAAIQCSNVEIASILGCHPDTLRDNYSTELNKGRQHGRMTLRRKQWESAMGGNTTMLIWLGKQYLAQTDRVESTVIDDERPLRELSDAELMERLKTKKQVNG